MWAGFGRPFVGTENAVIAENMCIEEFGICKMLRFLLDFFFFFSHKRAVGIPMHVSGWLGVIYQIPWPMGFSPHLQYKIFNFILIFFFNALEFNTKGTT